MKVEELLKDWAINNKKVYSITKYISIASFVLEQVFLKDYKIEGKNAVMYFEKDNKQFVFEAHDLLEININNDVKSSVQDIEVSNVVDVLRIIIGDSINFLFRSGSISCEDEIGYIQSDW